MTNTHSRRFFSALALFILVPAATIGTLAGLKWGPGTLWGQGTYFACKIILLAIPALWWFFERRARKNAGAVHATRSRPRIKFQTILPGLITGCAIFAAIFVTGLILKSLSVIDPVPLRQLAAKNYLTTPIIYVGFALLTTFINALLEEFVWRWFVTSRIADILPPTPQFPPLAAITAAAISAVCFTIHHVFVLSLYFPISVTLLGSLGVFAGGLIWSLHFVRSKSILPGYVSHILADISIFILGGLWIFS
jgi:membrane protease YdiL (CAAX protease family)